jgi:hypothetical protein
LTWQLCMDITAAGSHGLALEAVCIERWTLSWNKHRWRSVSTAK